MRITSPVHVAVGIESQRYCTCSWVKCKESPNHSHCYQYLSTAGNPWPSLTSASKTVPTNLHMIMLLNEIKRGFALRNENVENLC